MVVRKNTAQDTKVQEKKKKKKRVPSSDYLDILWRKWWWKNNPFDFEKAVIAKPLTVNWKILKRFADEMRLKFEGLKTSDQCDSFDQECAEFFKKEGLSVVVKNGKATVQKEIISASETSQKLSETKRTFSIPEKNAEKIDNARIALCMATVDAYAEWLKQMKKFKDFTDTRLKMWIFLSLPESEWLVFRHLAEHMKISDKTMYSQQFHHEVEMTRAFIMKKHFTKFTPKVVSSLVEAASKKDFDWKYNTQAMKLFLQYAESWKEWIDLNHDVKWWFSVSFWVQTSPFIKPADAQEEGSEDQSE